MDERVDLRRRDARTDRRLPAPTYRYLHGYCLDPGFSARLDTAAVNVVRYRIPYENVEPGPKGEYVEVMDFDPASGCWYEPVDLACQEVASQQGLAPSEGNPQFHQQLVYAVAMKTIRHFETALGRKLLWSRKRSPKVQNAPTGAGSFQDARVETHRDEWMAEYVQRLRIYPHALREANAYYDSDKKALLFGYFSAAEQSQGANFPGGLVFTCLSPDIVAHETTHAILDALHYRYMEDTNEDVAAFHEGFADIVALLQRFTFVELVEHQLYSTAGRMNRYSVLGELATQFGEALQGNRGALRSMIGARGDDQKWRPLEPRPDDYIDNTEAHARGAVLVATVFDAFQRVYTHRTEDLLRIASNGTGVLPEGSISRDLVHRLAREACQIAEHLLHICIRALDYCPPHDITFGDYLRALITADLAIAPEDETGFRLALIEAFRARGIFPDRVNTLSMDSLVWSPPDFDAAQEQEFTRLAAALKDYARQLVDTTSRLDLFLQSREAQARTFKRLSNREESLDELVWEKFLNKIGLTSRPVELLFETTEPQPRFLTQGVPKIEVHTIRPAFRAGREGRQVEQVIVSITQKVEVALPSNKKMVFRGGCTMVLKLGDTNTVEYIVQKNIRSYRRFKHQMAYQCGDSGGTPFDESMYADDDRPSRVNFRRLHAHGGRKPRTHA